MSEGILSTGENPTVILKVDGDLHLSGWERSEVRVREGGPITREGEALRIATRGDCRVDVPAKASVRIEVAGGDASVRDLDGSLEIQTVGADLNLRRVGAVTIGRVGGDLQARQVSGAMRVDHAGGDVSIKDARVAALVATAGGDLYLENAEGGLGSTVGGDAVVSFSPRAGQAYSLRAGGDIVCLLPADASAQVAARSGSGDIRIKVGGRNERVSAHQYQTTLGQGGAEISLMAGGDVVLTSEGFNLGGQTESYADFAADIASLGERISRKVNEQINGAEISERVNQITTEALRRAQEGVQAAIKRLDESMIVPPIPPVPSAPPAVQAEAVEPAASSAEGEQAAAAPAADEPPIEDERLIILRMLQHKKITVEEAEELLQALEMQADEGE